jgi:hypothetical protein
MKLKTFIFKVIKISCYHFIPYYHYDSCNKEMTLNSTLN